MENKRGYVQITVAEYDRLKATERALREVLNSKNCIELNWYYSYDIYGSHYYLINPTPDVKAILDELKQQTLEKLKNCNTVPYEKRKKRITLFDLGKRIEKLI